MTERLSTSTHSVPLKYISSLIFEPSSQTHLLSSVITGCDEVRMCRGEMKLPSACSTRFVWSFSMTTSTSQLSVGNSMVSPSVELSETNSSRACQVTHPASFLRNWSLCPDSLARLVFGISTIQRSQKRLEKLVLSSFTNLFGNSSDMNRNMDWRQLDFDWLVWMVRV